MVGTERAAEPRPEDPLPPTLKVAAVARRLGVAPATLRTWARRYGLGPSAHVAGAHRQYTSADLVRLLVMRRLTMEGVAPADAARVAAGTQMQDEAGARPLVMPLSSAAGRRILSLEAGPEGYGPSDPLGLGARAKYLGRAAAALDSVNCSVLLAQVIEDHGVITAWNSVMSPALSEVGRRFEETGGGIDIEHMLSLLVLAELVRATVIVPGEPKVLLACAQEESHSLPLHVLAAALSEQGVGSRLLGQQVPHDALLSAARRTEPAAVVLMAILPVPDAHQLADLAEAMPATRVYAAGPGWPSGEIPFNVRRLVSLPDAVGEIRALVPGFSD